MAHSLQGKTALITGAAKRIGREIALALADEGVNIVAHYRSSENEVAELIAGLREKGVQAWAIQADFEKPDDTESLIQRTMEHGGTLDILVNNASVFPSDRLEDLSWESFSKNMQVNAWAPFVLGREFRRLIGHGKIVNLEDQRIVGYDWTHAGYILSKHVLAVFTRMMALQYAPEITVNAVRPGLILPPPGRDMSYIEALAETVPLKRHGDPQDVADAVVFLVKSDFITGEVVYVDGGRHLREYVAERKSAR